MTELTLYVVRNGAGKYSTGGSGPSWSNKPKVWTNRGHAMSSLSGALKRGYSYDGSEHWIVPPADWELIEIKIDFEQSQNVSTKSVKTIAESRNRSILCKRKFGAAFAGLVEAIEEKGEELTWQWVLCVGTHKEPLAGELMIDQLKRNKLKKGKDYRVAYRQHEYAFAFKDKRQASLARLGFQGEVASIDIAEYVEVDIDAEEVSC